MSLPIDFSKTVSIAILAITFFTPLAFLSIKVPVPGGNLILREALHFKAVIFYFIFFFLFLNLSIHRLKSLRIKIDWITISSFIFIILCLIQFFYVKNMQDYLFSLPNVLVGPLFFLTIVLLKPAPEQLVFTSIIASMLIALYGILQHFNVFTPWIRRIGHQLYPDPSTTFEILNNSVEYLVTVLPLSILILLKQNTIKRLILVLSLLLVLIFCVLSKVRAGYLSIISISIFGTIMIFFSGNKSRLLLLIPMVTILFFTTAGDISNRFFSSFREINKFGSSTNYRIESWKTALHMILDNPLGVGIYQFEVWSPKYKTYAMDEIIHYLGIKVIRDAHNEYLTYASELGIPATFLFIFIVVAILYKRIRSYNNSYTHFGLILGIISQLVFMNFGFAPYDPGVKVQLWLHLGLLYDSGIKKEIEIRKIFFILPLIFSTLMLYFSILGTKKNLAVSKGFSFIETNRLEDAVKEFSKTPYPHLVANTLAMEGKLSEATKYYEHGLKIFPYDGSTRVKYAYVLLKLGMYNHCIAQLNKALETEKIKIAEIYSLLSVAYASIGACEKSFDFATKAFYEAKSGKLKTEKVKNLILNKVEHFTSMARKICKN